jgi:hypothetical protein
MPNISQKHPVSVFRGHLWTANEICETVCQLVNQHVLLGNPCVWDIPAICETHVKNWCLQVLRQNLFHIVSHMPYINHIYFIYYTPMKFPLVLWQFYGGNPQVDLIDRFPRDAYINSKSARVQVRQTMKRCETHGSSSPSKEPPQLKPQMPLINGYKWGSHSINLHKNWSSDLVTDVS